MGQYSNKGLYNSYKKNNKERDELDYYATPSVEVYNIYIKKSIRKEMINVKVKVSRQSS